MDKMREEFEKWFLEGNRLDSLVKKDGRYIYAPQQFMWEAWQASRRALVVEMPKQGEVTGSYDTEAFWVAVERCEDAIRAAGITVKGDE